MISTAFETGERGEPRITKITACCFQVDPGVEPLSSISSRLDLIPKLRCHSFHRRVETLIDADR